MAQGYTEKISGLDKQIAQLENRRRELMQKNKERERKARTKRLIERGGLIDGGRGAGCSCKPCRLCHIIIAYKTERAASRFGKGAFIYAGKRHACIADYRASASKRLVCQRSGIVGKYKF